MADLWMDLLECLDLHPVSGDGFPATEGDTGERTRVFEGRNQQLEYRRLFGGQLLAQFIRAATATCPDKTVKSLHVLFPKEGTADELVRYEVERHHEGRSFATLSILARQSDRIIGTATVSLHAAEDGVDQQDVAAPTTPPDEKHQVSLGLIPWETRTTADLDEPSAAAPEMDLWMRTPPVDEDLAPALTAYSTDLTLIGTSLRRLDGVSQRDAGTAFASAVTSHTLWFHRPFRTDDDWLVLRQHSPILAHGRSFGRGDVLTEGGSLVASYAQESLLRFLS